MWATDGRWAFLCFRQAATRRSCGVLGWSLLHTWMDHHHGKRYGRSLQSRTRACQQHQDALNINIRAAVPSPSGNPLGCTRDP